MEATVPAGDNEENTIPVVEETSLYHDLVNSTGQAETHSHEQNQPGIMSDKIILPNIRPKPNFIQHDLNSELEPEKEKPWSIGQCQAEDRHTDAEESEENTEEEESYEDRRAKNILDIKKEFQKHLGDIGEIYGKLAAPSRGRKKEKVESKADTPAPRRSLRQRAPVRYNQDELLQQEQPGPLASIPKDDDDDFNAEDEDSNCDSSDSDFEVEMEANACKNKKTGGSKRRAKSMKKTRPNKVIKFTEDCYEFVYCDVCKVEVHGGCSIHHKIVDANELKLVISKSSKKGAGDGLWNQGPTIVKNTIIGHYKGKRISYAELEEQKKSKTESGYCWELRDNNLDKVIGGIDPGPTPDRITNPLAFVNCAQYTIECNMEALQYGNKIFYRATRDIPAGVEMLIYYGNEYAQKLNIDTKKFQDQTDMFKCSFCEREFKEELDLYRHVQIEHLNAKRISFNKGYKCDLCPQEFYMIDYLESHKKRHHVESKGKHPCKVCGLYFVNLAGHKLTHTDKQFECHVCKKNFGRKDHLTKHQLTHTKTKNFQCDTCQKAFSQLYTLKEHYRVHTGEKPYACDKCDKAFSHLSALKDHYRVHTGEKPYKCDKCEKAFSVLTNLTVHYRTHTGEKPYKCDICEKTFTYSNQLVGHKKKHHPN